MSDNSLDFICYQRADPLGVAELESLLRQLWERGLRFDAGPAPGALTWEEQLQQTVEGFSAWSYATRAWDIFNGPLVTLIEHASHNGGFFHLYDRGLLYYLSFDNTLVPGNIEAPSDPAQYRFITFRTQTSNQQAWSYHYRPPALYSMLERQSPLLLSYQQVMYSFCHWVEVLCTLLTPVYGFAYNPEMELDEVHQDEQERENIPHLLQQHILPDVRTLLEVQGWLEYLDASLASPQQHEQWLATPQHIIKRLATGGDLCTFLPFHYPYEQGISFDYFYHGEVAREQGQESEAAAYYERAITIFQAIGEKEWESLTSSRLSHMRAMQRRRQAQGGSSIQGGGF